MKQQYLIPPGAYRGKHRDPSLRMWGYYSSCFRETTQRTARHSLQNASLVRGQKVANYHVWRQPWTPDSLTLVSDMADQKSLHRACNRHLSCLGYFYCWFVKTSASYLHCCQGLLLATGEFIFLPGSFLSHPGLYLAWLHQPSRG